MHIYYIIVDHNDFVYFKAGTVAITLSAFFYSYQKLNHEETNNYNYNYNSLYNSYLYILSYRKTDNPITDNYTNRHHIY